MDNDITYFYFINKYKKVKFFNCFILDSPGCCVTNVVGEVKVIDTGS